MKVPIYGRTAAMTVAALRKRTFTATPMPPCNCDLCLAQRKIAVAALAKEKRTQ